MVVCEDCPLRLFNTKHYNLQGIGNPYFGNCIVVPNVDYNAYKIGDMEFSKQVEVIKDLLAPISSTGVLDNLYILPMIRCNESISCKLTDDIYYRCLSHFKEDIVKYNFKRILLLGDAARRFLQVPIKDNLETLYISPNRRLYNVNYSPLVGHIDEDKGNVFQTYLYKWYNSCIENFYSYKKYVQL